MEKSKKIIVLIIVLVLVAFVGFILFTQLNKKEDKNETKENKKEEVTQNVEDKTTYIDNKDIIISLVKDYFYTEKLIKEDELLYWQIDNIKYVGKYKNNDSQYFVIDSHYKCKTNSTTCVYQEQVGDANNKGEYSFKFYVEINDTNLKSVQSSLSKENFIANEQLIKDKDNSMSQSVRNAVLNHYYDKDLAKSDNIESWEFSVQYQKNLNGEMHFFLNGSFKCKDNSSNCVYLAQQEEKNEDNSYPFKLYVYGTLENDQFTIKDFDQIG